MNTGDALLQAIVEDPDDDSLRLIYADWLADHGEADRAEFIRLELAMAPLMPDFDEAPEEWDSPEYHRLSTRAEKLGSEHDAEWFGPLNRLVEHFNTWRGFVHYADMTARRFADKAAEIFAAAPLLQRIYLDRFGKNVPAVARRPELARIRGLGFLETTLGSAGLAELCRSEHVHNLRSIDGMENRIGPEGGRALADSPHLGRLEKFDIPDNPFYDAGAEAVLTSRRLPTLRHLGLNNCGLTDWTARVLARNDGPPLHTLNLGHNHLTALGAGYLAASPRLASLRELTIFGNQLGDGVATLATSPHLRSLRELHVGWTQATDAGLAAVLRSENLAAVEELYLANNAFGPEASAALAATRLARMRRFHLRACQLTPESMRHLAAADLPDLDELELTANPVGADGVRRLVATRLLRPVRELRLDGCGVGDDGAEALAGADVLGNVRVLSLDENAIRSRGGLALAKSPHLANVARLYLRKNPLSKAAKKALLDRFGEGVVRFE